MPFFVVNLASLVLLIGFEDYLMDSFELLLSAWWDVMKIHMVGMPTWDRTWQSPAHFDASNKYLSYGGLAAHVALHWIAYGPSIYHESVFILYHFIRMQMLLNKTRERKMPSFGVILSEVWRINRTAVRYAHIKVFWCICWLLDWDVLTNHVDVWGSTAVHAMSVHY